MNCIIEAYRKIDPTPLSQEQQDLLCEVSIGYIMQVFRYTQLKKLLKPFGLEANQHLQFRAALSHHYNLALGLKMAVINWCNTKDFKPGTANRICNANYIPRHNAKLLRKLYTSRYYKAILRKAKSVVDGDTLTAPFLNSVVVKRDFEKLNNQIKYNCFKKLTFIRESNNMRPEDLEDEVKEMLLYTFYTVVPFQSDAHRYNSLNKSLHNIVLKRMHHYNTHKRRRMHGDGGKGYRLTIESISNYEGDMDEENSTIMLNAATMPVQDCLVDMSLDRFIKNGPLGRERIVNLLTLRSKEPEFVRFARNEAHIRSVTDCEDVFEKVGPTTYHSLVSKYLAVPVPVITKIRQDLHLILMN